MKKRSVRQQLPQPENRVQAPQHGAGGLSVRTDLRAGLAWDDLDDKARELWSNLTNALSSLTSEADTSS